MKTKLILLAAITCLTLSGCFMKPYTVSVQQGNIINKSLVSQLKPGMTKEHVKFLLGNPVLINAFDNHYWSYIYTKQIDGGKMVKKQLVLKFKNDNLEIIREFPAKK